LLIEILEEIVGKMETVLKGEIRRLAKREARALLAKPDDELRRLRKRVRALEGEVRAIKTQRAGEKAKAKVRAAVQEVPPEEADKARLSPGLIKKLRNRLKVSQAELAQLVGVTAAAVGHWEAGKSYPRPELKARIVALRSVGRREIKRLLAEQEA
jgi:DNA-binding transcriptional regulator YiaG